MDELVSLAALGRGEGWTEERHAAFLDRMELSFVQQELGAGADGVSDERRASRRLCCRVPPPPLAGGGRGQLPLDRPLPDSAVESNRGAPPSRPAARGAK